MNPSSPNSLLGNVYTTESKLGKRNFQAAQNATSTNVIPQIGFQQKILNNNNTGYPMDTIAREGNSSEDFVNLLSGKSRNIANFTNNPNMNVANTASGHINEGFTSLLSGMPMNQDNFTHNNMVPFFRGNHVQNMNPNAYSNQLGRYTGSDSTYRPVKTEKESFFDIVPNAGLPYGSPSFTMNEDIMSRYVAGQKRQGEKPIQDIHVGPGLAAGFTAEPVGGLNQANARDFVLPKNVDELRVLSNPKISYEGRVIAGLKRGQRGLQASVIKRRPEKWYKSDPERGNLSAAVKSAAIREKYYMRATNKQYQRSYYGGLGAANTLKPKKEGAYRRSTKNNYLAPNPHNAYRGDAWDIVKSGEGSQLVNDYGKHGYENKPNERMTTEDKLRYLNLTMAVKKIITPLTDLFRVTRKENFIGNIRPEGNMKAQMPSKVTVYEPDDIARTTIKETTIDNLHDGFLTGEKKNIVYDPNDVARTTIKELNIDNNAPYINMNPQQPRCLRVYDPEDIARTTMKELTIDQDHSGYVGWQDTYAGGYISTWVDMKPTQKQFLSNYFYSGIADGEVGRGTGRGYLAASYDAKNTNRQFTTIWEYQGTAKTQNGDAPTSYSDYYSARLNPNKEVISLGREPTQESAKLNAGMDQVHILPKKIEADQINIREPAEGIVYSVPPQKNTCGLTTTKDTLPDDTIRQRIEPQILDAFRKNPYTQSLHSAI